ncbi:MAG: DUF1697 domain-containing protein [Eubacteriales bacterium]|nr:DUF1697 domain-containing protein [Eubacteriales bacterium]MDD4104770.1 DUF1697 domain-containing protein [Eubacteriales bacterium]MDD4710213.1 DUF1697 domain-containing protein [Eubacteriales bacterium]
MIALLRGVTPTGKNRIPKMSYCVEILAGAGLKNVRTYIQSGNIIFDSELPFSILRELIHDTIKKHIGANLSVIIKTAEKLRIACRECPFGPEYDAGRVHLVFTNDPIDDVILSQVMEVQHGDEILAVGSECLYLYLPRSATRKKLNSTYLERKLGIAATMRKLNVVKHISDM